VKNSEFEQAYIKCKEALANAKIEDIIDKIDTNNTHFGNISNDNMSVYIGQLHYVRNRPIAHGFGIKLLRSWNFYISYWNDGIQIGKAIYYLSKNGVTYTWNFVDGTPINKTVAVIGL
jgi:hypothetical protein